MSKKYVIEIKPEYEDTTRSIMVLGARDGNLYVDALAVENLEELNSDYVNENFGGLQDDAYQRGLDDAWEAARKIVLTPEEGGISLLDLPEIFGSNSIHYCLRNYSASEAIEKLKAYEEKQKADDEIKVGDEVVWTEDEDTVIIVTLIYTSSGIEWCDGICRDGKVYQIITEHARKTGRHFDIDKILEEMKE